MSHTLVLILLVLALLGPLIGAIVLRLVFTRLGSMTFYGIAVVTFGVVVVSVLMLASSNISSLQVGGISLLLPVTGIDERELAVPLSTLVPMPDEPMDHSDASNDHSLEEEPVFSPSLTTVPSQSPLPVTPTSEPVATPATTPSLSRSRSPTSEVVPTEAPPQPTVTRRTYTVQPGDTLRSIAEALGVSVPALLEANGMTPEQADELRIGQELVVP